jgi:hypothetical protein
VGGRQVGEFVWTYREIISVSPNFTDCKNYLKNIKIEYNLTSSVKTCRSVLEMVLLLGGI